VWLGRPAAASWCVKTSITEAIDVNGAAISQNDRRWCVVTGVGAAFRLNRALVPARDKNWD
jgi:hypothetical protein